MRKLARVLAILGMMTGFASTLAAQDLKSGKWAITVIQPNGNTVNITLEVKRVPDPHVRWRIGTPELVTYSAMRGQNLLPLRDVRLEGEKFSFLAQGPVNKCDLNLQKDGSYAGECVGENGQQRAITMRPPEK